MNLNPDYESRLIFRSQEQYSIEWLASTLHCSVKFDTPPHSSEVANWPPYKGLMYASSTMVSDDSKEVRMFVTKNNELVCRKAAYKILRGMRKHGHL